MKSKIRRAPHTSFTLIEAKKNNTTDNSQLNYSGILKNRSHTSLSIPSEATKPHSQTITRGGGRTGEPFREEAARKKLEKKNLGCLHRRKKIGRERGATYILQNSIARILIKQCGSSTVPNGYTTKKALVTPRQEHRNSHPNKCQADVSFIPEKIVSQSVFTCCTRYLLEKN